MCLLPLIASRHHPNPLFSRDAALLISLVDTDHTLCSAQSYSPHSVSSSQSATAKAPRNSLWCPPNICKLHKFCICVSGFSKDNKCVRHRCRESSAGQETWLCINSIILKKKHVIDHRICFSAQIQTSVFFLYPRSPKTPFILIPSSLVLVLLSPAAWFLLPTLPVH